MSKSCLKSTETSFVSEYKILRLLLLRVFTHPSTIFRLGSDIIINRKIGISELVFVKIQQFKNA